MSEPPVAISIVDHSGDVGDELIIAQAVFDDRVEALEAVEILLRFWSFDQEDERRIEVVRA